MKKKQIEETMLISPEEAMKLLGCGRNRIYTDLLHRDDFPSFRLGSKWMVNRLGLQQWIEKQCSKTGSRKI